MSLDPGRVMGSALTPGDDIDDGGVKAFEDPCTPSHTQGINHSMGSYHTSVVCMHTIAGMVLNSHRPHVQKGARKDRATAMYIHGWDSVALPCGTSAWQKTAFALGDLGLRGTCAYPAWVYWGS